MTIIAPTSMRSAYSIAALAIVGAVGAIAIYMQGASHGPAGEVGASAASPSPASALIPATQPAAHVAPTPEPLADDRSEKQRSDDFWNAVTTFAKFGYEYDTLAEMTLDADLVVLGRVIELKPGQIEQFDPDPEGPQGAMNVTFGIIAIDSVLKGEPEPKIEGQILVSRLGVRTMTAADLPGGRVIIFLKNYAQERLREGVPPSSDADDRFYYARPNMYQAVLRETDGLVDLIVPPGLESVFKGTFLKGLDGREMDAVAEQIRDMARSDN